MNCQQIYNSLSDLIDKELPLETYLEIEDHLNVCPYCHTFLNTLKMTIKLSSRKKFIVIPEEVHYRLLEFLKRHLKIT
ncbi:zf-HC2 domain-containing protein [bacterium]|nr:zf-HC2 domain-containing protein [bacterium]MBU0899989.1 zf-HC2 domain-containing protein [bacterium]MBU1152969.1 zf-HC2 domain-containing protein [bacterium]MBU2599675.1 zf-HC2 domain-containing protein [bacterium]